jgi:hypothetical protein
MKRTSVLALTLSTLLLAGSAYAQEGTTRGGAQSGQPSTKQNSPATSQTTGVNSQTGGATSGQGATTGQGGAMDTKAMDDEKKKKSMGK